MVDFEEDIVSIDVFGVLLSFLEVPLLIEESADRLFKDISPNLQI